MNEIPAGLVTIADLYRELTGLRTDVGKALTQLEVINNVNQAADNVHRDHEARLRVVESFRWKLAGGVIALGTLGGAAAGYIALALSHR